MDDWRNAVPAPLSDARRRLEAFAAALRACAQSWHVADVEDLLQRAGILRNDPQTVEWFEQVVAFEIERCRRDAEADRNQLGMIDMIEPLLREPAAKG
ncbi:MAG TPA: hypothetical protein VGI81_02765 [Tepidisphaeraceae bacterium]|jgi:hypothetical protein